MSDMTTKTFKHGLAGYTKKKCRCDVCRAANREYSAAHYRANKEKIAARQAEYRVATRAKRLAQQAEYRAVNRAEIAGRKIKWRAANKDKVAAYNAEYLVENPDMYRAARLRRRARKADNGVWEILSGEWERVVARYRGCCAYCGVEDDNLEMDHVVPVAKGGGHRIGNFVPACRSCNSSKNDKFLSEWKLWKAKVGK